MKFFILRFEKMQLEKVGGLEPSSLIEVYAYVDKMRFFDCRKSAATMFDTRRIQRGISKITAVQHNVSPSGHIHQLAAAF